DVYPARAPHPVRLEFVGDTIESLRAYDPATQRSTMPIDQVTIVPLRDMLPADADRSAAEAPLDRTAMLFDYLARAKEIRIIVSERDEVDAAANRVEEQIRASYEEIVEAGRAGGAGGAGGEEPPAPEELIAGWETIAARLSHATELRQLAVSGVEGVGL